MISSKKIGKTTLVRQLLDTVSLPSYYASTTNRMFGDRLDILCKNLILLTCFSGS
jgi:hypothetical protein